jgi:hypothetical protein
MPAWPFSAVALADRDGWPRSVLYLATSRGVDPNLTGFALTALKTPYSPSQDENQSTFAPLVTFPS